MSKEKSMETGETNFLGIEYTLKDGSTLFAPADSPPEDVKEPECDHSWVYKILFDHTAVSICEKCHETQINTVKNASEIKIEKQTDNGNNR